MPKDSPELSTEIHMVDTKNLFEQRLLFVLKNPLNTQFSQKENTEMLSLVKFRRSWTRLTYSVY